MLGKNKTSEIGKCKNSRRKSFEKLLTEKSSRKSEQAILQGLSLPLNIPLTLRTALLAGIVFSFSKEYCYSCIDFSQKLCSLGCGYGSVSQDALILKSKKKKSLRGFILYSISILDSSCRSLKSCHLTKGMQGTGIEADVQGNTLVKIKLGF